MKRRPNLDALRLVLASLVVMFHTGELTRNLNLPSFHPFTLFQKGTLSVYFFFCISGFLIIFQLYSQKKETGAISIKRFYQNRAAKILPLYYLIVLIGILCYHVILPSLHIPFSTPYPLSNVIALHLFLMPNFAYYMYDLGGILAVLWSIGVEEQFYLFIAPLLAVIPTRSIQKSLLLLSILLLILYAGPIQGYFDRLGLLLFYFTMGGWWALLIVTGRVDKFLKNKFWQVAVLSLTVTLFCTNWLNTGSDLNNHIIQVLLMPSFIATISTFPIFQIRIQLINYLGKISYGIYMYHVLVLNVVAQLFLMAMPYINLPPILFASLILFLVFIFTFVIAHFSFLYFEQPILNRWRYKGDPAHPVI